MDDYINRFRNKVNIENTVSAKISDIIAQSLSRMEVTLERLQKAIPVVFINKDKEGGDESVMYSYTTDAVQIGDYITAFGKSHLVYKEVTNLKREDYIDCWKTVMCNIDFSFNGNTIKAYFRGPLRMVQSEEEDLNMNFGVDSKTESYLIIPSSITIPTNSTFKIDDNGWRVVDIDKTTNTGISYIALEKYNVVDLTKLSDEETELPVPVDDLRPILLAGVEYTFDTEDGYITADKTINILSRLATSIRFIVPFGPESITISIKSSGLVESTEYRVRG